MPFDPGQEQLLPLRASLPEGYTEGTDILKVFATVGTTNFRWLELPSLDQPPVKKSGTRGGPSDPLEQLLASVAEEPPEGATRNLDPAAYPSKEWIAAQVEVRVRSA